jgi:hypothetical protein
VIPGGLTTDCATASPGVPGWGSTISELMLSLADIPYEVVDVEGFDQPGPLPLTQPAHHGPGG